MNTSCKKIRQQFYDLLSNRKNEMEKNSIFQHLDICEDCHNEFRSMEKMWLKLSHIPDEKPTDNLSRQFFTMLRVYKQGAQERKREHPRMERFIDKLIHQLPKPGLQFAFSIVFLIIGFLLGTHAGVGKGVHSQYNQFTNELENMRQLVMLSLIKQESSIDRLQAINYTYELHQPSPEVINALEKTIEYDENTNVRLAALRALVPFANNVQVRENIISSFSKQYSPLVQVEIIDFICEYEKNPLPLLQKISGSENVYEVVQLQIDWTISNLKENKIKEQNNEKSYL